MAAAAASAGVGIALLCTCAEPLARLSLELWLPSMGALEVLRCLHSGRSCRKLAAISLAPVPRAAARTQAVTGAPLALGAAVRAGGLDPGTSHSIVTGLQPCDQ